MNTKGIYAILFCEMPIGQSVSGISSDASAKPSAVRAAVPGGRVKSGVLEGGIGMLTCEYHCGIGPRAGSIAGLWLYGCSTWSCPPDWLDVVAGTFGSVEGCRTC